jgi:hypothetical protein
MTNETENQHRLRFGSATLILGITTARYEAAPSTRRSVASACQETMEAIIVAKRPTAGIIWYPKPALSTLVPTKALRGAHLDPGLRRRRSVLQPRLTTSLIQVALPCASRRSTWQSPAAASLGKRRGLRFGSKGKDSGCERPSCWPPPSGPNTPRKPLQST